MTTTNGTEATNDADERDRRRREERDAYPFISVVTQSSGIHPSTSNLVAVDAVTFNDAGEIGEQFHSVINPGTDPGPRHLHGLSHDEVKAGKKFSQLLKTLDRLIDGRTLVVHDATVAWGFIVSEARRAMNSAARANRSRNRGKGRNRRRQRVGHVPKPDAIVDTLATARRQDVMLDDIRLEAVASKFGLQTDSPEATVERAGIAEKVTSRERNLLTKQLFLTQRERGDVASCNPKDLRSDRFGLQRSHVRVDAVDAPRPLPNPGPYQPGKELKEGMEVVVSPAVSADPNKIITAAMRRGLVYSEKLTRETSVVVTNETTHLSGKAMHGHRKNIPLLSDEAFLAAVERVQKQRNQGKSGS